MSTIEELVSLIPEATKQDIKSEYDIRCNVAQAHFELDQAKKNLEQLKHELFLAESKAVHERPETKVDDIEKIIPILQELVDVKYHSRVEKFARHMYKQCTQLGYLMYVQLMIDWDINGLVKYLTIYFQHSSGIILKWNKSWFANSVCVEDYYDDEDYDVVVETHMPISGITKQQITAIKQLNEHDLTINDVTVVVDFINSDENPGIYISTERYTRLKDVRDGVLKFFQLLSGLFPNYIR